MRRLGMTFWAPYSSPTACESVSWISVFQTCIAVCALLFFFRVVKINAGSWTCQFRQSLLPFHKTLHYTEWHKQMTRFLDINSHWRILHLLHPLNVIGLDCAQTRVRKDKRKTKSIWVCLKVKVKNRSNGVSSFLPCKWPFKWYRNDKSMYILHLKVLSTGYHGAASNRSLRIVKVSRILRPQLWPEWWFSHSYMGVSYWNHGFTKSI